MQRPQPSQPKKLSFSERKKWERMAQMTTERAPMGVCGRAERGERREKRGTHDDDGLDESVRCGQCVSTEEGEEGGGGRTDKVT